MTPFAPKRQRLATTQTAARALNSNATGGKATGCDHYAGSARDRLVAQSLARNGCVSCSLLLSSLLPHSRQHTESVKLCSHLVIRGHQDGFQAELVGPFYIIQTIIEENGFGGLYLQIV